MVSPLCIRTLNTATSPETKQEPEWTVQSCESNGITRQAIGFICFQQSCWACKHLHAGSSQTTPAMGIPHCCSGTLLESGRFLKSAELASMGECPFEGLFEVLRPCNDNDPCVQATVPHHKYVRARVSPLGQSLRPLLTHLQQARALRDSHQRLCPWPCIQRPLHAGQDLWMAVAGKGEILHRDCPSISFLLQGPKKLCRCLSSARF